MPQQMHTLAYGGVTTPRPLVDELAAAEIARQLVATAAESPYPVYAVDHYCDLIAWNRATASYYTDFGQLPAHRRNMLRWLLTSHEARQRLPDWSQDTPDTVARWRRATAGYHGDHRLRDLVSQFRQLRPEFVSCVVAFHIPVQDRDPLDQ